MLWLGRWEGLLSSAQRWSKSQYEERRCEENLPRKVAGVLRKVGKGPIMIVMFVRIAFLIIKKISFWIYQNNKYDDNDQLSTLPII